MKFFMVLKRMLTTQAKVKREVKVISYSMYAIIIVFICMDIVQYAWFSDYDITKWKCCVNFVYFGVFISRHFIIARRWGNGVVHIGNKSGLEVGFQGDYNFVLMIVIRVLTSTTIYVLIHFISCGLIVIIGIYEQHTEYVIAAIFICMEYTMFALDWSTSHKPARPIRDKCCGKIENFIRYYFADNLIPPQISDEVTRDQVVVVQEQAVELEESGGNESNDTEIGATEGVKNKDT